MADYVPPPGTKVVKKTKKRKKDPNAPKRPQTAFFVFSSKVLNNKIKTNTTVHMIPKNWLDYLAL